MAKRRVKLLAARPIDDELLMSGSVVELPEQQAKQLESQGRAVWAPGAELSPRSSKARHNRLNDRATRPDKPPEDNTNTEPKGPSLPLDVNGAKAEDLAQVEHLNEKVAKAIVEHRDKNGLFASVVKTDDDDGLTAVKGIGQATAEKLAAGILVANQPESTALNINEATAEQLAEAISGVGEATAGDIIAWRKKLDGFKSLEQVAEVGGVSLEQLEAADVTV